MKRQPFYQSDFSVEELAARRSELAQRIGQSAVGVIAGAGPTRSFEVFRQFNEFYYLCGIEVPHAYLLLQDDGRSKLYLPPCDPQEGRSEGATLNCDDGQVIGELTGIEQVGSLEDLKQDLAGVSILYTPLEPCEGSMQSRDVLKHGLDTIAKDPWRLQQSPQDYFRAVIEDACGHDQMRDLSPMLDDMRQVKSAREIELMYRAGRLSALAVTEAMRSTKPGLIEYHLEALADYVYRVNGARGGAYRAIVAGGENIWNAHYYRNNCPLVDGQLVLMDYAPDLGYYTSDIGRIWPVNGTYSPLQRQLYGFIVEYHMALLKVIRPGVTADQVMIEAAGQMRQVVEEWSFSKDIYKDAALNTLEFKGHMSHGVGMAVHEAGDYRTQPLRPGVVFALDPQMWVPQEQLYIRVEDTIAITEDGYINVTADAPLDLDDVEAVMREPGLLQTRPEFLLKF